MKSTTMQWVHENVRLEWVLRDYLPSPEGWDLDGDLLSGDCPECGESGRLHVHSGAQFFCCDSCHQSGDVFRAYMIAHKCSFPEAVKALSAIAGPCPMDSVP